ncbi:Sensor histidine kinase ResE [subsurface metagenome]
MPFPLIHVIIPPRKELVRKLEETENNLKESERKYQEAYLRANFYKELFTHDIRNIIQNFSMSVDILKKHQKGEMNINSGDIESLYKIMTKQIKRSKKLINNLQTLSNIESGEFELIPINLIENLSNTIEFIQDSFSPKQIKIDVESFTDQVYINGNELLVNAIENMLLNAISYNESKIPKILIKISMIKENKIRYIKTEFIDNGIGIPDIIKEKIFLKGYKEIKGKKGMGLGLSLVTKIIELFNGKIWVEDHVKGDYTQGSNFIFLIPEAFSHKISNEKG